MAGVVAAAIVLAATFVVIQRAADRIPMRLFFRVTSFMLYALAIVFVGQGVASLQEASVVPATFVNYAPTIPMLGIFPTIQSLGAQAVLLIFALAAVFVPRNAAGRSVRVTEQSEMRRARQA
jgi:high-affinity iron transporter